jgi:hypothetical protein
MKGQEVSQAPGGLVELNMELCIAYLNDAIKYLHEVVGRLGKVRDSIKELREWYGDYRA